MVITDGTPAYTRDEKVKELPPPAIALRRPVKNPAIIKRSHSNMVQFFKLKSWRMEYAYFFHFSVVTRGTMANDSLFGRDFLILRGITFLALCNTAVFFNFYPYLLSLGFSTQETGMLIGLYPLSSMVMYGALSRCITSQNACVTMVMGLLITACCGIAYQFLTAMLPLGLIRIASGLGLFLTMASCMTLFVAVIPPLQAGLAFSLYSVAMLLPYSIMPAITELTQSWFANPATMYMLTAMLLVPTAFLVALHKTSMCSNICVEQASADESPDNSNYRHNLLRGQIAAILFVNATYFFLFSSLFYFLKGYGLEQGIENPGYFFTIQMGIMVTIRLFGSRVFDMYSKERLILAALVITGIGYGFLAVGVSGFLFFAIAALFGMGMGLCIPPLNALMYLHSEPHFRGYNANMMMLAMHFGSFAGPFGGSWLIAGGGYPAYCAGSIGLILLAAVAILFLMRWKQPVAGSKSA